MTVASTSTVIEHIDSILPGCNSLVHNLDEVKEQKKMCTLLQIQLILTYRIQARFLHHHAGRSFRELFRDTHGYRQFIYAFLHVPPSVYGPWNVDILCWTYTEEVILHHSSDTHISSGGHIYRLVHMGILTLLLLGIESLYRKPRVRSVAPASRPRPTDICHS